MEWYKEERERAGESERNMRDSGEVAWWQLATQNEKHGQRGDGRYLQL